MIKLYNEASNELIGEISQAQLNTLVDLLVEETQEDQDYYINEVTLDMLAARGADKSLVDMLRQALGAEEGIEILWKEA
ncbi:MAG: galactosyldiacylglycerol synthase [Chloroflexi bacterium]|nr:galactosyldiacylglycerol synthase [Chloroflexota bacterium]